MARRLLLPLLLALGVSAADSNTPKAAASTETTPATGSAVVDPPAAAPVAAVSQIVKAVKTALAGSSLASVDPALALSDDGSIAEAMNITDVLPSSDINSPECLQQRIADTCLSTLAARAGSAGLQDAVVECLRFRVLQRTTDPAGDESIECEAKPQNSELEDLTQMQDPSTAAASAGNNEQNARLLAQRLMTLGVDAAKAAKLAAETVPVVDAGNKDGSASLQSSLQGSMSRVQSLSAATADADIKRLDDEDSSALTSDGERFKTSVDRWFTRHGGVDRGRRGGSGGSDDDDTIVFDDSDSSEDTWVRGGFGKHLRRHGEWHDTFERETERVEVEVRTRIDDDRRRRRDAYRRELDVQIDVAVRDFRRRHGCGDGRGGRGGRRARFCADFERWFRNTVGARRRRQLDDAWRREDVDVRVIIDSARDAARARRRRTRADYEAARRRDDDDAARVFARWYRDRRDADRRRRRFRRADRRRRSRDDHRTGIVVRVRVIRDDRRRFRDRRDRARQRWRF